MRSLKSHCFLRKLSDSEFLLFEHLRNTGGNGRTGQVGGVES